jgi:hypothetical protein
MNNIVNNTDVNLIKLARIIYELVLHEEDKEVLVLLDGVGLEARSIFQNRDDFKKTLHPDLGFNISTFTIFKIETNDAAYRDYRENSREMIEDLEKEYDITFSPTPEPHKKEKDLIKLARVIYELVLHEEDMKVLFNFYKLALETKNVFDASFKDTGEHRTTLGENIQKFIDRKIGSSGDKDVSPSFYEWETREMIEKLEKQYGIAAK